jgi:putative redox protein
VAAADWLRREYAAPSILIGHSLGGAAVLAAAGGIRESRAVVTMNAPFSPEHVTNLFADGRAQIEGEGEATVSIGGRLFKVKREFLLDLSSQRQAERIRELRRALLIMHGPTDAVVGIDNASAIFTAARHPKSFIALDGADHLLLRAEDARYAAQIMAAWVGRYLPPVNGALKGRAHTVTEQ